MSETLYTITWVLAAIGAASALAGAVCKTTGTVSSPWPERLYLMSYLFVGLSAILFICRGFMNRNVSP
jgi:predicted membrane channel-forming protein YqfA (hemolysin III family)